MLSSGVGLKASAAAAAVAGVAACSSTALLSVERSVYHVTQHSYIDCGTAAAAFLGATFSSSA